MPATATDITIEQGATFSLPLSIDAALNGLTPVAVIRRAFGGAVVAVLDCSEITAESTTVSLTAAETAALVGHALPMTRTAVLGVWDMLVDNAGTLVRPFEGQALLSRGAT